MLLFTTWCKQQQLLCLLFLCSQPLDKHLQFLDNCSTDLCNGDLQITITLFNRTASTHRTDRTLLTHLSALPYLLYGKRNSLINVFEDECPWLHLLAISININIVVYWLSYTLLVIILRNFYTTQGSQYNNNFIGSTIMRREKEFPNNAINWKVWKLWNWSRL